MPVTYRQLFWDWRLAKSTSTGDCFIFADIKRLSRSARRRASQIRDHFQCHGHLSLNDPAVSWDRFTLLTHFYNVGINRFQIKRLNEDLSELRYPVFLRCSDDHRGSLTDLIFLDEELHYLQSNPHQAELRRIFDLANIRFGRIDYAVADGCIQVWQINTNPRLESIMLSSSAITDESLTPLASSMSLENSSMERTQVTNTGVDDVHEDLLVPPSGSNWLACHSRKYCRLPRNPPRC